MHLLLFYVSMAETEFCAYNEDWGGSGNIVLVLTLLVRMAPHHTEYVGLYKRQLLTFLQVLSVNHITLIIQ